MAASLDDMGMFFEVARAGSITAAARALELPKSTVSRRLIRFEEQLGAKLFHKTTRRITLTELGESYLERCERVVREMDEAQAFLQSVTTRATGVLRLTMPVDLGIHYLADFLVAFARRHPDLKLAVDYNPRRADLVGERFDVALRTGAVLPDSSLVASRLIPVPRGLYARPDYVAETGTPRRPADLVRHRFVLLDAHVRPRAEMTMTAGSKTARVAMSGSIVSNSLGNVRALALAGGGIGVLPHRMCTEDVAAGRLVRLLPAWSAPPLDAWYVIPSRRLLPAKTRLFVEELVAHFRQPATAGRR